VAILDANGRQLLNYNAGGLTTVTLNTGLPSGLYIIRISDPGGAYYKKYVIR